MFVGKRNLLVVLTIVTALAIGGVSAVRANGTSGNVIYACVNNGGVTSPDPRFINTASLSNFDLTGWGATWFVTEDVDLAVVFTEAICVNVAP